MQSNQHTWKNAAWTPSRPTRDPRVGLVLVFGARHMLSDDDVLSGIREAFPAAAIVGCSTAGEISGTAVRDDSLAVTAVRFDATQLRGATRDIGGEPSSHEIGASLARELIADDLVHVLVFSDGTRVNGSELARGFASALPPGVALTGGLAADGAAFERTVVVAEGRARESCVTAVGLYGRRLRVGFGSRGGWDAFGPGRRITRARGNALYDLDGEPALALYERFLGDHAAR